jgi:D-glycero-D-manno-heptose 1,7-bisphosphate phosphatase
MTRLILLDRDGVINVDTPDYIKAPHEWEPLPGALDAIAALKRAHYRLAVCTNQSGIGRGLFSDEDLSRVHAKLAVQLAARGVALDAIRYCPHDPDAGCLCRKPRPGMLLATLEEFAIPPSEAIFIGDSLRDIEAAHAAGCAAGLVRTGNGALAEADARALGVNWVGDDLAAFARWLLGGSRC